MTEFYKGTIACNIGQSTYQVVFPKLNYPLSYPVASLVLPSGSAQMLQVAVTNKTTVSFDIIVSPAPTATGYSLNWQINVPGTDVAEYVNDKRYFSKEEIGGANLAKVHWKNVIAAPDMSSEGLKNSHNHSNLYYSKSEIVPVIDSRVANSGSSSPLASTIMVRDGHGRSQINSPKVVADITNKGYVDTKVAGEASARIATDMIIQSSVAEISGSYATNDYAYSLQNQINVLESLIMSISGTGFYSGGSVPVGTIICQATSTSLGFDWGYCDGGSLAVSANGELFDVIGYTFGGSGANFNKPDLRGEFVRGWDDGKGIDTGRVLGSSQSDDNKAHVHSTNVNSAGSHDHTLTIDTSSGNHTHPVLVDGVYGHTHGLLSVFNNDAGGFAVGPGPGGITAGQVTDTQTSGAHTHTASISSSGMHGHTGSMVSAGSHTHSVTINSTGSESRPRNVALKFFIKISTPVVTEPVDVNSVQSISGQKTFINRIVVPNLPQAIVFGDPDVVGTRALGMIGTQMAISIQSSPGVWTPETWLS
jgi:hypothetical protein